MRCSLPQCKQEEDVQQPRWYLEQLTAPLPQSGRSPSTLGGALLDCALGNGLDGVYGIEGCLAAKSRQFVVRAENSAHKRANPVVGWPSGN